MERSGIHFPVSIGIEVIGSTGEDDGYFGVTFRAVDVGRETGAIAHRHHDFLVDKGNFVQLDEDGLLLCEGDWSVAQNENEC